MLCAKLVISILLLRQRREVAINSRAKSFDILPKESDLLHRLPEVVHFVVTRHDFRTGGNCFLGFLEDCSVKILLSICMPCIVTNLP